MTTPWPCTTCGATGRRNLGTRGYCAVHLGRLYEQFDSRVFQLRGMGAQHGVLRPEYGPDVADLRCVACGATWTGVIAEPCYWCEQSYQIMVDYQAELVLRVPEIDRNDRRWSASMQAWAERLANAVKAGLVPEDLAMRVLERSAA